MSRSSSLNKWLSVSILILILHLSACTKPALQVEYHTLSPLAHPSTPHMDTPGEILVGPVRVSPFLDQGPIVRQRTPYSAYLLEQHHWAGDLDKMLSRLLIQNLTIELGHEKIYSYPDTSKESGVRLAINFFHFERDTGGNAVLEARWKIISNKDQRILHSTSSKQSAVPDNTDYDALAEGLSRCMAQLSHEIAAAIQKIQTTPESTQEKP